MLSEPGGANRESVWLWHTIPSCLWALLHARQVALPGGHQETSQLLDCKVTASKDSSCGAVCDVAAVIVQDAGLLVVGLKLWGCVWCGCCNSSGCRVAGCWTQAVGLCVMWLLVLFQTARSINKLLQTRPWSLVVFHWSVRCHGW